MKWPQALSVTQTASTAIGLSCNERHPCARSPGRSVRGNADGERPAARSLVKGQTRGAPQ